MYMNKEKIQHNLHKDKVKIYKQEKFLLDIYQDYDPEDYDFSNIPLYLTVRPKSYNNIY